MKQATTYLILKASRSPWGSKDPESGLRPIDAVRVVASRANRPATLQRDEVAIKVTVEVPDEIFNPISPAALIVVPTDLAIRGPIDAQVDEPGEATE